MADPLEVLLRPVAQYLNRAISEVTPARELCDDLDGRVVAVRVRDTALAMYFVFSDGRVELATDYGADPDVVVSGSLLTLAGMIGNGGTDAIRAGGLHLTGDAQVAESFRDLLAFTKPDIEEELSGLIGDVAAHQLGEVARGVRRWAQDISATMRGNVREYLQEESRDVPSRYEVERFTAEVDALRDDVERIAARLDRLEQQ